MVTDQDTDVITVCFTLAGSSDDFYCASKINNMDINYQGHNGLVQESRSQLNIARQNRFLFNRTKFELSSVATLVHYFGSFVQKNLGVPFQNC